MNPFGGNSLIFGITSCIVALFFGPTYVAGPASILGLSILAIACGIVGIVRARKVGTSIVASLIGIGFGLIPLIASAYFAFINLR